MFATKHCRAAPGAGNTTPRDGAFRAWLWCEGLRSLAFARPTSGSTAGARRARAPPWAVRRSASTGQPPDGHARAPSSRRNLPFQQLAAPRKTATRAVRFLSARSLQRLGGMLAIRREPDASFCDSAPRRALTRRSKPRALSPGPRQSAVRRRPQMHKFTLGTSDSRPPLQAQADADSKRKSPRGPTLRPLAHGRKRSTSADGSSSPNPREALCQLTSSRSASGRLSGRAAAIW